MEDSLQFDYVFKYILVGDTSVGKTSLLSNYSRNEFAGTSNPTMGVEFATKKVQMAGQLIKLQIWDTAGQESFRTITRAYYKNAIGVILVYDLTNPMTMEGLESWLAEIEQNSNEKVEIILAGNKVDLAQNKELAPTVDLAKFKRYQTSAKTGQNVSKMFGELTASVLDKINRGEIKPDGSHGVKKGNATRPTRLRNDELSGVKQQSTGFKCC